MDDGMPWLIMNLNQLAAVIGELTSTCELSKDYFLQRGCFIDARGILEVDGTANFGFGVRVLTQSHDINGGEFGGTINRKVVIGKNVWIGSFALLYNCIIHDGAIVAAGAVVKSCEIMPNTMVAGNPAQVIARRVGGKWIYLIEKWRVLQ